MRKAIVGWIAACLCVFLYASYVDGKTLRFKALTDTVLVEDVATPQGRSSSIFTGRIKGGLRCRPLLKFDVSDVPEGAEVKSVALLLHQVSPNTLSKHPNINLHTMRTPWSTGITTWEYASIKAERSWDRPGGDYSKRKVASPTFPKSLIMKWSSRAMTRDVEEWLRTPGKNHGWTIIADDMDDLVYFFSSDSAMRKQRPTLRIVYEVPKVACCLQSGKCVSVHATDCKDVGGKEQKTCSASTCKPEFIPPPPAAKSGSCCLPEGTCVLSERDICEQFEGFYGGDGSSCVDQYCPFELEKFVDELPIPEVLQPVDGQVGGAAIYHIEALEIRQKLHRDLPETLLWGYEGTYPGPTIEARKDSPITVLWRNSLQDTTAQGKKETVLHSHRLSVAPMCIMGVNHWKDAPRLVPHLHGGKIPSKSDGQPDRPILPSHTDTYVYPNEQSSSTLWYHDHALGITRLNVYMGLAGFYFLRSHRESSLDLPSGRYEIPLVIQDRKIQNDGSLFYPSSWSGTFYADKILVNGKIWPFKTVARTEYRLRILNGADSRTFSLTMVVEGSGNVLPFHVIGLDQDFLPSPVEQTVLTVHPGERRDVIVDFSGISLGKKIKLVNSAGAPYGTTANVVPDIMRFDVIEEVNVKSRFKMPKSMNHRDFFNTKDSMNTRRLHLVTSPTECSMSAWTVDGRKYEDISEVITKGTIETWIFVNPSGQVHPMHLHLVQFHVLWRRKIATFGFGEGETTYETDKIAPGVLDGGWRDTVPVHANEEVAVIAKFSEYTGRFAYHCHVLSHEDNDMMRQFRVINDEDHCNKNGICEANEDCFSCPSDCAQSSGAVCGNNLCEAGDGETCKTCPQDCMKNKVEGICCGVSHVNTTSMEEGPCVSDVCFSNNHGCRTDETLPSCCGDDVCEGTENSLSCSIDCNCAFWGRAAGCQASHKLPIMEDLLQTTSAFDFNFMS